MKEFILFKVYIILLELARYLILILSAIYLYLMYPILLKSNTIFIISSVVILFVYVVYELIYKNKIKGKIGKFITQKVIESYCNKRGYSYLYDIILKSDMKVSSQIDHLIITRKGIAVIETKYHEGRIYGSEFSRGWLYVNKENKSQRHCYNNPIRENHGHIEALKKIINKEAEYYNMVLYIDTVNLDKCQIFKDFIKVGYTHNLNKILENFDKLSEKKLSSTEAFEIYNKIKESNITDKELRQKHINRIKQIKHKKFFVKKKVSSKNKVKVVKKDKKV